GFDVSPILKHKQPSTIVIGYSAKAQIINQFYNKEVIGSIYHQIEKRSRVSIAELELITHLPLLVIEPIVNIFIELKLINLIDGIIEAILPVSKQNLADSISYNRMMETRRLVDFLTNESLPTLKQYFLNLMEA
ncbi:MAG: single-stranded-DNA-specific exonuclease C-terminal domain-containing protein, partial [Candidatus Izemoplasmatales bacterium]